MPTTNRNLQLLFRLDIRALFLDFCSECDRSMWIAIVFDPENRTTTELATLLMLLYAPTELQGRHGSHPTAITTTTITTTILGNIKWNFAEEEGNNACYEYSYRMMADVVARLTISSCYPPILDSLELMLSVFGKHPHKQHQASD